MRITSSREAWGNHISYDGEGIGVSAMTIKQICELHKISSIDLLKMDIEGAEVDVFANGEFLDRVEFLIAELHGEYRALEFRGRYGRATASWQPAQAICPVCALLLHGVRNRKCDRTPNLRGA